MRIGVLSGVNEKSRSHNSARFVYEIEERGHKAEIINYNKSVISILESGRELSRIDQKGRLRSIDVDVVIPRMSKSAIGIIALEMLVSKGIPTTASPDSIRTASDKLKTQILLDQHGIATPYSIAPIGSTPRKLTPLLDLVEPNRKRPIITKMRKGSQGKGVIIADSRRSAISQIQGVPSSHPYMIQEFIDPIEADVHADYRVITIGGLSKIAMRRSTKNVDEFRANISLSGRGDEHILTDREVEIAERASDILGGSVLGVDIMRSARGPLVTEVNSNPGLGIEKITGFNVVGAIVEHAIYLAEQRYQ